MLFLFTVHFLLAKNGIAHLSRVAVAIAPARCGLRPCVESHWRCHFFAFFPSVASLLVESHWRCFLNRVNMLSLPLTTENDSFSGAARLPQKMGLLTFYRVALALLVLCSVHIRTYPYKRLAAAQQICLTCLTCPTCPIKPSWRHSRNDRLQKCNCLTNCGVFCHRQSS